MARRRSNRLATALVFASFAALRAFFGVAPCLAGDDQATLPDDAALEASGAVVGSIEIEARDIFDPSREDEDRWLFRLANRLHVETRERTLRALLLFRSGDPYRRTVLDESERILREQSYLYDADIRPVRVRNGVVDVAVVTRDVWTLKPLLSFRRTGGVNTYRIGIEEENLLGLGKELAVRRQKDVDRSSTFFRYRDPNLLGAHGRMELVYSDNSDGVLRAAALARPFYALDSRWAAGVAGLDDDRIDRRYSLGEETDRFRHRREFLEVHSGWSDGVVDGVVVRWSAGYAYDLHRFSAVEDAGPGPRPPADRLLAYPWAQWQRIRSDFLETRDVDHIGRTEDLDLGRSFRLRAGWIDTAFGADRDRLLLEGSYADAARPGPRQLLLWRIDAAGRFGGRDGVEHGLVSGEVRWDRVVFGRQRFHVRLRGDAGRRLDDEVQLLLGGEEGLRGYPIRYMDGDRRVLLTVEQRFYTDLHVLRLVRVGAAAFLDVGRAWYAAGDGRPERDWQSDVGAGLRLGSSRSSTASLVHLDVAFPIGAEPSIDSVQFLVTTHETF